MPSSLHLSLEVPFEVASLSTEADFLLVHNADLSEVSGEISKLVGARPHVVSPQMLRESCVAFLIVGVLGKQIIEIAQRAHVVPPVLLEVFKGPNHRCCVHLIVEHGFEQVHDEVIFQVRRLGRRKITRRLDDSLYVVRAAHRVDNTHVGARPLPKNTDSASGT